MSVTKNYNQMRKAIDFQNQNQWYRQMYLNKYFDLYKTQFKVEGLEYQQLDYLFNQLWEVGSVWLRKDDITEEPVLCKYAATNYNLYGYPTGVTLVNKNNAPETMIPNILQQVDKDGVILYLRPNHKGFEFDIIQQIGRLSDCQMAIDMNLYLQKFPWLIVAEPEMKNQMTDLVNKIFNNEPVIYTTADPKSITNIRLDTPYIIDKLRAYQTELDNQIKTLLGVDNQGGFLNSQQQNLDTTNSNNGEINSTIDGYVATLQDGFDRAKRVLGLNLKVTRASKPVDQIGISKDSGGKGENKDDLL